MKFLAPILSLLASASFAGQFNLTLENDAPWHSDNDYTHGTRIEYVTDDGFRFGVQQQMYTPNYLLKEEQVEGNHPYAGTLLGFAGYRFLDEVTDDLVVYDDIELSMGVLGPSSHADDVQRCIHKWLGCKDPKGWDTQLKDEFEVNAVYWKGLDTRMIGDDFGWNVRWNTEIGGCLGTLQIFGGMNTEFKFGYGFGPGELDDEMRIRAVRRPPFHIYAIAGLEGRWWGHNELLEGNASYVHNHVTMPVEKKDLTGCFKAGVGARYRGVDVRCLWLWWSREYTTQEDVPHYMSLTVGFGF